MLIYNILQFEPNGLNLVEIYQVEYGVLGLRDFWENRAFAGLCTGQENLLCLRLPSVKKAARPKRNILLA
jgi:hypothetical protein